MTNYLGTQYGSRMKAPGRRTRVQLLITFALLVLVTPDTSCVRAKECAIPPDPAFAQVIPEGFGVNIHFTDPQPGELKMLAGTGVRWVRMDFKWDLTETEKGKYDFAPYERLVSALQPFDLRALFILDYGNPLYDGGGPPRTEETRQAFSRWAVAAAKRFAGRGIIWEVYNEPNNDAFWRPRTNANEYAQLALAVGRAFHSELPNENLIGPAVGEMDFKFIEESLKSGPLEYWSAVSVHPYLRTDPELVENEYCRLREMIKRYSPVTMATSRQVPIMSSEWGYSSIWRGMNEQRQGEFVARQWLTNVANHIPLSIWYDWRDDGVDPNDPEHHFGLVSNAYHDGREPVYDPKPAYLAAKTLTSFLRGYRFEKRLPAGSPDDYILMFSKDGNRRFAAWTRSGRSHEVVIAVEPVEYTAVGHAGEDAGMIASGSKGLTIKLTNAPVYLRKSREP